jgi:hypothetical protein
MKSLLALLAVLALFTASAHALSNEELAGVYEGPADVNLPGGQNVSATFTNTYRRNGKMKTVLTVLGQTITSKGTYNFAAENILVGTVEGGIVTAIVELDGKALTFTGLTRLDSAGTVIVVRATGTRIKRL